MPIFLPLIIRMSEDSIPQLTAEPMTKGVLSDPRLGSAGRACLQEREEVPDGLSFGVLEGRRMVRWTLPIFRTGDPWIQRADRSRRRGVYCEGLLMAHLFCREPQGPACVASGEWGVGMV
jgi:hypothetical protein